MDTKIESSLGEEHDLSKEETVQQLMILYGNAVLHLAFTYVKDRSAAEDIAQETFLKCFEKIDQFQKQSSAKTWLYRIAINLCKDYLKSWHHRKIKYNLADLLKVRKTVDTNSDVENEVIHHHERADLSRRVMRLPVKYREVILLHYYEELAVREISEILKTEEATIRTRIRRARQMLKQAYSEEGEKR